MKPDDLVGLLRAFAADDRRRFLATASSIAAHEESMGRSVTARRLCDILAATPAERPKPPETKPNTMTALPMPPPNPAAARGAEFVSPSVPRLTLDDLVLDAKVAKALAGLVGEWRHADALRAEEVEPALRVVFDGPPGTGKTSAAGALALELGVPFVLAHQERIQGCYLGETAKALADVFAYAAVTPCVLLFDEFDSFGGARQTAGSSAATENNRSLNVLLQLMERHRGPALIVAATNLSGSLDIALPRRFDMSVHFPAPTDEQRRELIRRVLGDDTWTCDRTSHAEVVRDATIERKRRVLARLAAEAEVEAA